MSTVGRLRSGFLCLRRRARSRPLRSSGCVVPRPKPDVRPRDWENRAMPIRVDGLVPLIQVFDMPTSVAFYRDVLGFAVMNQSEPGDNFDWGMLRLGDAVVMLNTAY